MKSTDKTEFAAVMTQAWRFYDKKPSGEDLADWFELLAGFELAQIAAAFNRHLTDPKHGSYLPKPADIFRHLPSASADDGRPGADEAWGMLLRVIRDERETAVLTDEMRAGWTACQPILDLGDEVGARMAFRETYSRAVENARKIAVATRWTPTLGTDPTLREKRLTEAVAARRIGLDRVTALLPGPTPTAISQVAGLLTGPGASAEELRMAERLQALAAMLPPHLATLAAERTQSLVALPPDERPGALAAMLRSSFAETEQRRAEERQQQRDDEAAKKAAIREWLDQRQQQRDSGQEAA